MMSRNIRSNRSVKITKNKICNGEKKKHNFNTTLYNDKNLQGSNVAHISRNDPN